MNRDYINGKSDNIIFFTGKEVEHTPAYNMETMFVVGIQDYKFLINDVIAEHHRKTSKPCTHVFCGANHSFKPKEEMLTNGKDLFDTIESWDNMICGLLDFGLLVSLDFDVKDLEVILEMRCNEYDNFIPQVSVKMPYIKQLNYNAMLKIDDKDFKASNPGVWCHRVHALLGPEKFTPWRAYEKDEPI